MRQFSAYGVLLDIIWGTFKNNNFDITQIELLCTTWGVFQANQIMIIHGYQLSSDSTDFIYL